MTTESKVYDSYFGKRIIFSTDGNKSFYEGYVMEETPQFAKVRAQQDDYTPPTTAWIHKSTIKAII